MLLTEFPVILVNSSIRVQCQTTNGKAEPNLLPGLKTADNLTKAATEQIVDINMSLRMGFLRSHSDSFPECFDIVTNPALHASWLMNQMHLELDLIPLFQSTFSQKKAHALLNISLFMMAL